MMLNFASRSPLWHIGIDVTAWARTSLGTQVPGVLIAYAARLSIAVFVHGQSVYSQAEDIIWHSLLQSEHEHSIARGDEDANYQWTDTDSVQVFGDDHASPIPTEYPKCGPGVHDAVRHCNLDMVILVREDLCHMLRQEITGCLPCARHTSSAAPQS